MKKQINFSLLSSGVFNSRIKSVDVSNAERWLGFFTGPSIVACMFAICGQTYLNVFYTDVLNLSPVAGGLFLSIMPIVCQSLAGITNVIMGQFINRTKSRCGKARPWILCSGPLLMTAGILIFMVPTGSFPIQLLWVVSSYGLFFCVAYPMYNVANVLMVPLSTRSSKQRDSLALFLSMGVNMLPGILVSILFPVFFLPWMGTEQSKWIIVMSVISLITLPAALVQFYFTRERITEESAASVNETSHISLKKQLKGCLSSKYWVIVISIIITFFLTQNFFVTNLIYYANWVVGTYNDGRTYTLLNAIGQFPLGVGVFILWPLVKKYGKRNIMMIGSLIVIGGSMAGLFSPANIVIVLAGLFIRSFGMVPLTYMLLAMLADALDHVEQKNGFRCDGVSSSIYSIVFTVCTGIATGVFNLLLGWLGYAAPSADGSWVEQSQSVQNLFISGVFIVQSAGAAVIFFLLKFYKPEKTAAVTR